MIEHESYKLYNSMKHVPRGGVGYGRDRRSESRVDTKCDLCFHFGTEIICLCWPPLAARKK